MATNNGSRCPMGVRNDVRISGLEREMKKVWEHLDEIRFGWKQLIIIAIVCLVGSGSGGALATLIKSLGK